MAWCYSARLVADELRASSSLSTSATLLLNLLKAVELRLGQWVHALSTASACIESVLYTKRRAVKSPSALLLCAD
jgi:hypothetical protein